MSFETRLVTATAQVPLVNAGDGETLIANGDVNNTIYLTDQYGSQAASLQTIPLAPGGFIAFDGKSTIYGVCSTGQSANAYVIPGGLNFFQLIELIVKTLIIKGTSNGEFTYDVSNNLVGAQVGGTVNDPIHGITCYEGITTFNGHGAAVNYLSTVMSKAGFVQYEDLGTSTQGVRILSVNSETASWVEPYHGDTIGVGMVGVDPLFGDSLQVIGANITFGQVTYTLSGAVQALSGSGTTNPSISMSGPEQGVAGHSTLTLQGNWSSGNKNAVVKATTGAGLSGTLAIAQTDHQTFAVTGITATQASKAWSIPAGDANVDSLYRLTVTVFGQEGTITTNLGWSVGLDGVAIATGLMAPSPASALFRGKCVIEFHILTTGAGGTADYELWASKGTTASPADVHNTATGSASAGGQAFDTTVAHTLELMLAWANVTGSPTITSFCSLFERVGP